MQKPIVGANAAQLSPQRPVSGRAPGKKRWAFSFRYWKQVEYFGLDRSDPKWFVSLLERLNELSKLDIESLKTDRVAAGRWRYHSIDWTKKNVPIERKDLDWIDSDYLENEDEYPLLQFQISRALGRVVGFWDESDVFNVVLLDPLHNIQPSKDYDYKVDPCDMLSCEYSSLVFELDRVTAKASCGPDCNVARELTTITTARSVLETYDILVVRLDDGQLAQARDAVGTGLVSSHSEIFQEGIKYILDVANQ